MTAEKMTLVTFTETEKDLLNDTLHIIGNLYENMDSTESLISLNEDDEATWSEETIGEFYEFLHSLVDSEYFKIV